MFLAYLHCSLRIFSTSAHAFQSKLEFWCFVLEKRRKYPILTWRKSSWTKGNNQEQTEPTCGPGQDLSSSTWVAAPPSPTSLSVQLKHCRTQWVLPIVSLFNLIIIHFTHICFLIGWEPTVNSGNQHNLQISLFICLQISDQSVGCMHSAIDFQEQCQTLCDGVFVVIFFKTMYNKTIVRFDFCDWINWRSG